MAAILERIASGWHLMRIMRLAIGLMLLIMGIQSRDWMMGSFSLFFLYQALTDTGCCGSAGCNTPRNMQHRHMIQDEATIEYEEIK